MGFRITFSSISQRWKRRLEEVWCSRTIPDGRAPRAQPTRHRPNSQRGKLVWLVASLPHYLEGHSLMARSCLTFARSGSQSTNTSRAPTVLLSNSSACYSASAKNTHSLKGTCPAPGASPLPDLSSFMREALSCPFYRRQRGSRSVIA